MKTQNTIKLIGLAAAAAIALTGCGAGDGGDSSDLSETTYYHGGEVTYRTSHLSDATVCVDSNGNAQCDADEPTTTTDANGNFSFDAPDTASLGTAIIVEAKSGVAYESDSGTRVTEDFVIGGKQTGSVLTIRDGKHKSVNNKYTVSMIMHYETYRVNPADDVTEYDYNYIEASTGEYGWSQAGRERNIYVSSIYEKLDRLIDQQMITNGFVPTEENSYARFMYKSELLRCQNSVTSDDRGSTFIGPFYKLKEYINLEVPMSEDDVVSAVFNEMDFTNMQQATAAIQVNFDNGEPFECSGY